MNINELNSIADNIRSTDSAVRAKQFDGVKRYCIEKHNAAIAVLRDVYSFVEGNFDLFDSPSISWDTGLRRFNCYTIYDIGSKNPYNCVIRDFHHEKYHESDGGRIYWVDGGIIFHVDRDNHICYLTDCGRPNVCDYEGEHREFNDSGDFVHFNYGVGFNQGYDIRYAVKTPEWEKNLWSEDNFPITIDEFNASKVKKAVEEDLDHAERVLAKLTESLKRINESIISRRDTVDATIDGSLNRKVAKFTIEITKVEE